MKKILSFVLCLTLTLPLLFSCGKSGLSSDVLGKESKNFPKYYNASGAVSLGGGYTEAKNIAVPRGATKIVAEGGFLSYKNNTSNRYYVYSAYTGSNILSFADEGSPKITLYEKYVAVAKTENGKKTTAVYSETGNHLITLDGDAALSVSESGFTSGDLFYRIDDGMLTKTYHVPPFFDASRLVFVGDYAVYEKENSVIYYDESFNPVAFYEVPGEAVQHSFQLLAGGNLLVQYMIAHAPSDKSYDVMISGLLSCDLYTYLYNPAEDKASKLDLDVIVNRVFNAHNDEISSSLSFSKIFSAEVENVLEYVTLKDGQPDTAHVYHATLSNDGKVGDSLSSFIKDQNGMIYPLKNGTYAAPTKTGYAILGADGAIKTSLITLGTATGYGYLQGSKVYSSEMKLAVDLSTYESAFKCENAVLYYKTVDGVTEYYIYTKDGERKIEGPKDTTFSASLTDNYYTVAYDARYDIVQHFDYTRYDVYTLDGTLLLSYSDWDADYNYHRLEVLAETDDAMIVRYLNADTMLESYACLLK